MKSIERIGLIDKSKLSKEFYFNSLMEEACRLNMLTDSDIERIQFECIELLSYKVERYNMGDSSSIPIETAESIMKSNLYTIGLSLKTFLCPDDAVKAIKENSIRSLYDSGRKNIDTKLKALKLLHELIIKNVIHIENYTYSSTVIDAIKGFFKIYNPDYASDEIHITADYPTYIPITDLKGIEFIQKYLEYIYCENTFCGFFPSDNIHHLLCGYDENYADLIFNIFEHVLATAIGCKLLNIDAVSLNVTENQMQYLYHILLSKSEDIIYKAYNELKDELHISDTLMEQYIERSLPSIASKILSAAKMGTLHTVVLMQKYPELMQKCYFSFGERMEDEKYRLIIDDILKCRFLSDKIAIIKDKIHSLADFEDLLLDAELEDDEIMEMLGILEISEISALAKRHPTADGIKAIDLSEEEKRLSQCIDCYVRSLPLEKQEWIAKAINILT